MIFELTKLIFCCSLTTLVNRSRQATEINRVGNGDGDGDMRILNVNSNRHDVRLCTLSQLLRLLEIPTVSAYTRQGGTQRSTLRIVTDLVRNETMFKRERNLDGTRSSRTCAQTSPNDCNQDGGVVDWGVEFC